MRGGGLGPAPAEGDLGGQLTVAAGPERVYFIRMRSCPHAEATFSPTKRS